MIVEGLLNGIYTLIELLFGWITLPNFPTQLTSSINSFFNVVFDNIGIIFLVVRPITIKIAIPILIAILNFDKVYKLTMYIERKLPLSIE